MIYSPPGMRRWFKTILDQAAPNVTVMNYAYWDRLFNCRKLKSALRVIDAIDIISLNTQMQRAIRDSLPTPLRADKVQGQVLNENFFENGGFNASLEEFWIYDKYGYSIAIIAKEARRVPGFRRNRSTDKNCRSNGARAACHRRTFRG